MATITTSDELRLYNRTRVLSSLRSAGRQSRTCVSESTGLSASTVSQVTADLINDGVIERVTPCQPQNAASAPNTRRGRPQVLLQLNSSAATTAVLTLMLNYLEATLYDYSGKEIYTETKVLKTNGLSLSSLKKQLYSALDKAISASRCDENSLRHITVACQGTVTRDNSGLLWSPITKLKNIDLRTIMQQRYTADITVANDCSMIARSIFYEKQAASDSLSSQSADDNFATILSSYGIGLGFFHHGDILTGSHSSGTEFGHMLFKPGGALCRCGRSGCIEAYASEYAIWRKATGLPPDTKPIDRVPEEEFAQLLTRAQLKAGPERSAFEEAGASIGQGLANLFAIFDPFPTMFVGIAPDAFELMKEPLISNLQHYGKDDQVSRFISVYDHATERKLIRSGACLQSLSYIDENVFGFGAGYSAGYGESAKQQEAAEL